MASEHRLRPAEHQPTTFAATEYVPFVPMDAPRYGGPYEVIPGATEQTLATKGTVLNADVLVAAIPSNYGLVTWNGAVLTVS